LTKSRARRQFLPGRPEKTIVSITYWLIAVVAACLVLPLVGWWLRQRPFRWFGFSIEDEALVEEPAVSLSPSTPDGVKRAAVSPVTVSWWRRQG